jgi:hypothetical protein
MPAEIQLEDASTSPCLPQEQVLGLVDFCSYEAAPPRVRVICHHYSPMRLLDLFFPSTLPNPENQGCLSPCHIWEEATLHAREKRASPFKREKTSKTPSILSDIPKMSCVPCRTVATEGERFSSAEMPVVPDGFHMQLLLLPRPR